MASLLQLGPQLEDLGILLWSCVAWVSTLGGGSNGRVVVVVVLGVELQLVGGSGSNLVQNLGEKRSLRGSKELVGNCVLRGLKGSYRGARTSMLTKWVQFAAVKRPSRTLPLIIIRPAP